MAIKPILFNTEMVRAILDGRKSCTRRNVKSQQLIGMLPDKCKNGAPEEFLKEKKLMFKPYCDMTDIELINTAYKAPYQPGDILYVRETWGYPIALNSDKQYVFRADEVAESGFKNDSHIWHPSIHMPKEAARIWLKVTNVRVERLQEISAESALAEGADKYIHTNGGLDENMTITSFIGIWNSTIKKSDLDRYGWDANPYVWIIEFERCEKPKGV
ncbi:MAG: hypothetical protein SPL82_00080 [Lachnospiraceae bacterium]|nr:hypothetical protein [Lachnospiraceae bacterium]